MATKSKPILLNHVFEIYVPTQCQCQKLLPTKERDSVLAHVKTTMSEWFGGGTSRQDTIRVDKVKGLWTHEDGSLAEEDVHVVYSNANAAQYEEYQDSFAQLIVDVGIQLTQDSAAGRVDDRMLIFPTKQAKCIHEVAPTAATAAVPKPVVPSSLDRRRAIQASLIRFNKLEQARELFCHILHYDYTDEIIPMPQWPDRVKECLAEGESPHVIAEYNDFKIVYLKLRENRLLHSKERPLIERIIIDNPTMRGLLVVSDFDEKEWHLINVKYDVDSEDHSRMLIRRMRIGPHEEMRTIVDRLSKTDIDEIGEDASAQTIQDVHDEAFDVQAVTNDFFRRYREIFYSVEESVEGYGKSDNEKEARHLFTQQLFNRLMFIGFIQKKGWLKINDSTDYLGELWRDYRGKAIKGSNFHSEKLQELFFNGLNNPRGFSNAAIGSGPFLNGGLFERSDSDANDKLFVPDESIRKILFCLLAPFNFTVTESTPLDQEVAIDPEMLGTIFEELVTGRHESGSYYTPKPIVTYMCKESLKGHIQTNCPGESDTTISEFVDRYDPSGIHNPEKLFNAVKSVTVCDPACGSGAYLLGMLHELMELRSCLFASHNVGAAEAFERKLEIIQDCIYGVDIDIFAVNIARLRLWLSLAVEFDGERPPALPNLDFKIECGDSLTAPNPQVADGLFQLEANALIREVVDLQNEYLISTGSEKYRRRQRIIELEAEIQNICSSVPNPVGAFDWRIGFASVFVNGGFSIVLSNPPYVRMQELKRSDPHLPSWLKTHYKSATKGNYDLYVVFVERGLQLLSSTGYFAYILPHKFFNAKYGAPLRELIAQGEHLSQIVHFGDQQVFSSATNYVCLLFLSKSPEKSFSFVTVDSLSRWLYNGEATSGQISARKASAEEWAFIVGPKADLFEKLTTIPNSLSNIASKVFQGLVTGSDAVFVLHRAPQKTLFSKATEDTVELEPDLLHPLCKGSVDLKRYFVTSLERMILFPYEVTEGHAKLIPPTYMRKYYPKTWQYLLQNRSRLEARERGKWKHDRWYAFGRSQALSEMEQPKILTPSIAAFASFSLDESDQYYFLGSGGGGGGGYGITLDQAYRLDVKFVLGLLNSRLLDTYLQAITSRFSGGYYAYNRQYIEKLPIHLVDWSNDTESEHHQAISDLVSRVIIMKQHDASSDTSGLEHEIDLRVYDLYGLSKGEIALVEKKHK
jgi:type I restriction-modification system DNA methylase subunit